ncbi:unnamed protein product [Lota lota]
MFLPIPLHSVLNGLVSSVVFREEPPPPPPALYTAVSQSASEKRGAMALVSGRPPASEPRGARLLSLLVRKELTSRDGESGASWWWGVVRGSGGPMISSGTDLSLRTSQGTNSSADGGVTAAVEQPVSVVDRKAFSSNWIQRVRPALSAGLVGFLSLFGASGAERGAKLGSWGEPGPPPPQSSYPWCFFFLFLCSTGRLRALAFRGPLAAIKVRPRGKARESLRRRADITHTDTIKVPAADQRSKPREQSRLGPLLSPLRDNAWQREIDLRLAYLPVTL